MYDRMLCKKFISRGDIHIHVYFVHTVVTTLIRANLQLHQIFMPAIFGKITITRCLSTIYNQHVHENVKTPSVHNLLQPPGVRPRPPATVHNGFDVAVVKLDQLINWCRKVSVFVYAPLSHRNNVQKQSDQSGQRLTTILLPLAHSQQG